MGALVRLLFWILGMILILTTLRRLIFALAVIKYQIPENSQSSTILPEMLLICAIRNGREDFASLVQSIEELDYPTDLITVVLVDDASTDGTTTEIYLETQRHYGWHCIRNSGAQPWGKGRSIANAFASVVAPPPIVIVLDVDHELHHLALKNLLKYYSDPTVAAVAFRHEVKARCLKSVIAYYCRLEGLVTEEITSRSQATMGLQPKLAGVWSARSTVMIDYNPAPQHVPDDFDFTAQLSAEGYKIAYAADVISFHEVPISVKQYWTQHLRWATAIFRRAPANIVSFFKLPLFTLFDGAMLMLGYFDRPAIASYALLLATQWDEIGIFGIFPLVIAMGGVGVTVAAALIVTNSSPQVWWLSLFSLIFVPLDIIVSIVGLILAVLGRRVRWR